MLIKKKMLLISGTIGFLSLALAGGIGIPSVLSITSLIEKIAVEQAKIDDRYALRRFVRNSVAALAETKRLLGTLSTVALQDGHELEFVTALERAAIQTGVEQHLTLETVNQKDLSLWEREIPFKIEAHGEYPKMLAYMIAIERLPFILVVDSIQIGAPRISSGITGDGVVEALIQGSVYWQGPKAPDFVHGKANEVPLPDDAN